ncbi:hypothetical protein SteCoe_20845 [Stentor coeruleus]|uniref:Uncharacterized protein n=1 Tax=Stentor coeruleus TaxID=5963 RepID=A0A1R2BQV8_9CILI|nr:hypothetical protein SteCoe_20845 [Stentor coeruleus]
MISWLEKILPSCCSHRNYNQSDNSQKPDLSHNFAKDIQIIPENEGENISKKEQNFVYDESVAQISQIFFPPNNDIDYSSSTSLSISFSEIEEHIEILCAKCLNNASGFCPLCPNKRFCKQCFSKKHSLTAGHLFIEYEEKKMITKKLNSFAKIKSLLKFS